jgi:hypothetical protein
MTQDAALCHNGRAEEARFVKRLSASACAPWRRIPRRRPAAAVDGHAADIIVYYALNVIIT